MDPNADRQKQLAAEEYFIKIMNKKPTKISGSQGRTQTIIPRGENPCSKEPRGSSHGIMVSKDQQGVRGEEMLEVLGD